MQMEYTQEYSGEMGCFLNMIATSFAPTLQAHLPRCQQTFPATLLRLLDLDNF